jgi:hypothetical protein
MFATQANFTGQLFISAHNEPVSVAAMRVRDEDCSPPGNP